MAAVVSPLPEAREYDVQAVVCLRLLALEDREAPACGVVLILETWKDQCCG